MKYKNMGYNRLLVGNLYSWEVDDTDAIVLGRKEKITELSGG